MTLRALVGRVDVDGVTLEASAVVDVTHQHGTPGRATRTLLDGEHFPDGFTVPAGEVWEFDPAGPVTVTSGGNVVVEGTLRMGHCPHGHVLRFVDVDEAAFVGGHSDTPLATDVGLYVVGHGVLDAVGTDRTPWTRAAGPLAAGATTIQLQTTPVGWQPGDELVVTPTRSWTASRSAASDYDTALVVAVDGRTVTLDRPLAVAHPEALLPRGLRFGAEVLNLTRSVVIEGTPDGHAHVQFLHGHATPQHVANLRLRHMGPRKHQGGAYKGTPVATPVLGRYALHFHHGGDGSRGSTVDNVVVTDSTTHAFVAHLSHGVTFTGCIAHGTVGSQFWWDPGDRTQDVLYRQCVASAATSLRLDPDQTEWNGYRLAGFWLGSRHVPATVTDCVAVGVLGGRDSGGFVWPEGDHGFWVFRDNLAHNNLHHGLFNWQNVTDPHDVERAVTYHNGWSEIFNGAYVNTYRWIDCVAVHDGDDPARPSAWPAPAAFEAHAINRGYAAQGQPVLTLDRCWLENRSGGDAYLSPKHNIAIGADPIRVRHCVFDGAFRRRPHIEERVRLEHCVWLRPDTLRFGGKSGSGPSVWEVEDTRHGTIRLTDPAGGAYDPTYDADVTTIAPFSTLPPIQELPDLPWPSPPGA